MFSRFDEPLDAALTAEFAWMLRRVTRRWRRSGAPVAPAREYTGVLGRVEPSLAPLAADAGSTRPPRAREPHLPERPIMSTSRTCERMMHPISGPISKNR